MSQHERSRTNAEDAIQSMGAQYAALAEECEGWKRQCGELEKTIDDLRSTIDDLQNELKAMDN